MAKQPLQQVNVALGLKRVCIVNGQQRGRLGAGPALLCLDAAVAASSPPILPYLSSQNLSQIFSQVDRPSLPQARTSKQVCNNTSYVANGRYLGSQPSGTHRQAHLHTACCELLATQKSQLTPCQLHTSAPPACPQKPQYKYLSAFCTVPILD